MKKIAILMDNTFTRIHLNHTGSRIDFRTLKGYFEEEDNDVVAHFFFQKNDTLEWPQYHDLVEQFSSYGWEIHNPVDQSIRNLSYTPAMEASGLISQAVQEAVRLDESGGANEIVLCVSHLSYVPMIDLIREFYPHLMITLVCDPEHANDELLKRVDNVINMYDLELSH